MTWDNWTALVSQQPLLLCFLTIALGMGIGAVRLFGLSLGTSGVLFAAILFGYLGRNEDWTLPDGIGTLGLVLFVYAVGLGSGKTFFRTFLTQGKRLAILSVATIAVAALVTVLISVVFGLPPSMSVGIFAGSMTSTPGLAAATGAVESGSAAEVLIGYGMAYPIGVVFTVMYVQLWPRLTRVDLDALGRLLGKTNGSHHEIKRTLIEIANPEVFGKRLSELGALQSLSSQVTRVLKDERLVPVTSDHMLEQGQVLLLVADDDSAELVTLALGRPSMVDPVIDADRDRSEVVVTNPDFLEKPLRELHLRSRYGITVSRVERHEVSFVPSGNSTLNMADRIVVVGPHDALKQFEADAGHQPRRLMETDLMSLGIGLTCGIVLGAIPVSIGSGELKLGMAGGPLVAGLLFAHFGRFLGVVGYVPRPARMFLQSFGVVLFLADSGFEAGKQLLPMLSEYGIRPALMSAVITVAAIATAHIVARSLLRMNLLEALGGACGAMTSTAGVGAITSKTESDIPVTSYAAAYPVALVLMTLIVRIVVTGCAALGEIGLP